MMDRASIEAELQNFFQKSSLDDWKKIALQETGGEDPFQKLLWRGKDEILFLPYYDAQTDNELQFLRSFDLSTTTDTPRQWLNLPSVKTHNAHAANKLSLEHLMEGADGVLYDARHDTAPDLNALTNNIEWPGCYIGFYTSENHLFLESLQNIIADKFLPASVRGALFWEAIPKSNDLSFFFDSCPSFNALGLLIPQSSPAEEISNALTLGVNALEAFKNNIAPEILFRSISFSVPVDATLLETVAKLKALRLLWFQVTQAYGVGGYRPQDLFIHTRSLRSPDDAFGPHENMIKATFAAISSVIGGCNALTVEAVAAAPFITRHARNVSTILREESFFDRAADAFAGAWTVDALTNAIASKSWTLFQQKSKDHAAT